MKKTSKSKVKNLAAQEQALFLVTQALKLNLSVSSQLNEKSELQFVIKNPNYTLESFPSALNELEFLRVEEFLATYKKTQESESKTEELFNHLINNLSLDHKKVLNFT